MYIQGIIIGGVLHGSLSMLCLVYPCRALLVSWFISVCSRNLHDQTTHDVACEKEHLLPGSTPREGLVQ